MSTLDPISAPGLADTIAERLRTAIQTGVYPPGTRLPERPIAAELGVSHIPVREALARLAEEGLVDREPRRGARVAALTARQLDEISTLRIVLEQFVARRVQAVWTPTIERQLRAVASFLISATRALPPADLREHALTHVALIEALASGDRVRAERETERHISLAADRIRRSLPPEEVA